MPAVSRDQRSLKIIDESTIQLNFKHLFHEGKLRKINLCILEKRKGKGLAGTSLSELRGYQEDTGKLFALVQQYTQSDHGWHNSFISETSFIYLSPQAFFVSFAQATMQHKSYLSTLLPLE